jgi:hypothetical protein
MGEDAAKDGPATGRNSNMGRAISTFTRRLNKIR